MPAYAIATNVGVDASVVDKPLEQDNSDLGYDLARGLFSQIKKIKIIYILVISYVQVTNRADENAFIFV